MLAQLTKFYLLPACVLALVGQAPLRAQSLENLAVRAHAVVQRSPPRITLEWAADPEATAYTVFRKAPAAAAWGTSIGSIPAAAGTATQFVDNSVAVGTAYEYLLVKTWMGVGNLGQGYVAAGIELPVVERRGTVVLLVADTHAAYLAADLALLEQDLVGDGWQVRRHDVPASSTPPQVKALILADYAADPTQVQAVFLLGHVAVPYSGALYPDGHPDHNGAWPADAYYGDLDGTWTDTYVNETSASRPENRNVPGDGKFDQVFLASSLELQVGRVDLADLPAFAPLTERDLLRRYLRKDHQFRHNAFAVPERGLIDDNFGAFGSEAFANNGWRNMSALLGPGQVANLDYFSTLQTEPYLWAYACGGGWYSGAGGVGSTGNFAAQPVKSVFNMMFGSYFGDWDTSDNFLRAALAADGYTLTNCWAGRPNWHFQQMALGETVGHAARLTQNNRSTYATNYGANFVHVGLMGDPTLRLHPLAPASGLAAAAAAGQAVLSWTASAGPVLGYYVYRSPTAGGVFTRLTPTPLAATATTYTDPAPLAGPSTYQVRALELRATASSSYYNLSQAAFASFVNAGPLPVTLAAGLVDGLRAYPSVFAGELRVELALPGAGPVRLRLLDALGRACWQGQYAGRAGPNRWVLALPPLPAGCYVLTTDGPAGPQRQRLLRE